MNKTPKTCGTWLSPISSDSLASAGITLSDLCVSGGNLYWNEGRPLEGGRAVIVRDGSDLLPAGFNARTRAHEYGGGSWTAHAGVVFFSNFADQRIYRVDPGGSAPHPITPEPSLPAGIRYADARVTPDGKFLVCVRESHGEACEPANELVVVPTDGATDPRVIAHGHDFYSSPRLSPDGNKLAWLTWDHPNMPWDGTELWVATFSADAGLSDITKIAGGATESIFQPEWSPSSILHYISDRTGWWNLYADQTPLKKIDAEFGVPQWGFNMSRYGFLGEDRIACVYSEEGLDRFAILACKTGMLEIWPLAYTSYSDIRTDGADHVFLIAAAPSLAPEIVKLDVRDKSLQVLKSSASVTFNPEDLSTPEPIEYPTGQNRTAHALYYPPRNSVYTAPAGEKPPLLVMIHGGPTGMATSSLRLSLQFWTCRGFAVVDVNYGGSSGYGREYRERLNGMWGIVDVEDCIQAARYLAARGDVDPKRMAIRGGSAGGYTTLSALVFHDVFAAGASHYGVGDLTALAGDTHKFESRYLDKLIGPYPAAADVYRQRSPVHFADRLSCPVILFQGLEDKVVPPNQAEAFTAALQAKGLPYEYVTFPDEGHGFRKAENIRRAAELELRFYARVFGLL